MYINFNQLEKLSIKWQDNLVLILQCIYQKDYEKLKDCRVGLIELFNRGYVIKVKPPRKDTEKYLLARLSDSGKKFLKDLSVAELTDESRELAGRLISLYESNNLNVDNKKKIVEKLSWLMAECPDFTADKIYSTVEDYISITKKEFTSGLNNLLWKGENIWAKNWNTSGSKLYTLLTKN